MATEDINSGLLLKIPLSGTQNWATQIKNGAWIPISSHDHTGSGNGSQLDTASIRDGAITQAKLATNIGTTQITKAFGAGEGGYSVNWNLGTSYVLDLSSGAVDTNAAITLTNPITGGRYFIKMISNATYTFSFATTILWPGGFNPAGASYELSVSSGGVDVIELYYDGANYLGRWEVGLS